MGRFLFWWEPSFIFAKLNFFQTTFHLVNMTTRPSPFKLILPRPAYPEASFEMHFTKGWPFGDNNIWNLGGILGGFISEFILVSLLSISWFNKNRPKYFRIGANPSKKYWVILGICPLLGQNVFYFTPPLNSSWAELW